MERYSTSAAPVKTGRRERRLLETRRRILDAAMRRFLSDGYVATTVETIAEDADVAVQTIYNTFGSKGRTLAAALDRAVTGTDVPTPTVDVLKRELGPDPHSAHAVTVLTRFFVAAHARTAPIYRLIREASAVDPELADLGREIDKRRLATLEIVCRRLARLGALPAFVRPEDAAACVWTLASPHAYGFFVREAGWSAKRYERWLAGSLSRSLFVEQRGGGYAARVCGAVG